MERRLLSMDPQTGITRWFHYDHTNDTFTIETEQRVDDIVDRTKSSFNSTDERARWGDGQMVASIPLSIYYDLKRQGIIDPEGDPSGKKLAKWLNDADNRAFRTRPGRV